MAFRTVGVRLMAEVSGYVNNITRAAAVTKGFAHELDKAAKAGKLDAVADKAAMAGIALAGGFLVVAAAAAKFEKQMSAVKAATHASTQDMERLRAASLQAGKDTKYSATQAAKGVEELAKAGVSAANILGGGLRGALALAAAGELDVGEAAETAASAMTQFKLTGAQLPHVADLLAAAAGKAQGSVHDMGMALNMSGLVAAQVGLSIEEATGSLAAFANAGLIGSDSGTSFKTMLMRLTAPTAEAAQLMDKLGIETFNAQGKFVGMEKFAGNLQGALAGLTDEQRNAALAVIFGADAIRAASIVYEQGEAGIGGWIKKTNDAGYAADTAAMKTDNLIGDVERLTGSLETLAIESGSGANAGLRLLAQSANALVDAFGAMPPVLSSSMVVMVGLTGAALLGFAAWAKLRSSINTALEELAQTGPVGQKAATALGTVTKFAGRAALALTALEVASAVGRSFRDAEPDTVKMAAALDKLATSGEKAGEFARVFGTDMKQIQKDLKFIKNTGGLTEAIKGTAWEPGFLAGFDWSLQSTTDRVKGLDNALADMVNNGKSEQAAAAIKALGISTEDAKILLPGYTAGLEGAAKSTDRLAAGQQAALAQSKAMAGGLAAAVKEAGSLVKLFDQLNGAALGWAQAENTLQAAIDDSMEAIRENGKTAIEHGTILQANTEKGRENRDGLISIAEATKDAIQARYEDTGSLQAANVVYEEGRKAFINAAIAAGLTKQKAKELADQWLKMPPLATTTVVTPGLDAAIRKLERLRYLASKANFSVNAYDPEGLVRNRHGGVYEKAATGTLREAAVYSPANPGRYMIAEPETKGEAFIPKSGDYGRSMSILDKAASWYGASVQPTRSTWQAGTRSTATIIHEHHHTLTLNGTSVLSGLRDEVDLRGGNVQKVVGSRR